MNRCELCEKEAVCDVTSLEEPDVVRSYCEDHAPGGAGSFGGVEDLMPKFQRVIENIETQLRDSDSIVLPDADPVAPGATMGKQEAQAFVEYLRRLVDFVRLNKRMPDDGELSD